MQRMLLKSAETEVLEHLKSQNFLHPQPWWE